MDDLMTFASIDSASLITDLGAMGNTIASSLLQGMNGAVGAGVAATESLAQSVGTAQNTGQGFGLNA